METGFLLCFLSFTQLKKNETSILIPDRYVNFEKKMLELLQSILIEHN